MKIRTAEPRYSRASGMKAGKSTGSPFDHMKISSGAAVEFAAQKYYSVEGQLRYFEMTRWRKWKAAIPLEKIVSIAEKHSAVVEAVQEIMFLCQAQNQQKTITRKEIRDLTGHPAMPTMKAVSEILGFPYSLRGLNPNRAYEKGMGARGHPVYQR
jgi:hypothetical protein